MKNKKLLIFSILLNNILGLIFALISNTNEALTEIIKPTFTPPPIVFPIAWIIFYTILGITSYNIYVSQDKNKNKALLLYIINMVLNYLWVIIFFKLKLFLLSFIWLIILISVVIAMIYNFYKIDKKSGLLNIPYLLWLIFASILNLSIYYLN